MNLLGTPFLLLVVGVTLAALLGTGALALWLGRHRPWWGPAGLGVALVAVMTVGALLSATVVNRVFSFYGSTSELTGGQAPAVLARSVADPIGLTVRTPHWQASGRSRAMHGQGMVIRVSLPGAVSGITRDGFVYLPAAYFQDVHLPLPVLELFPGHPGKPGNYLTGLHLAQVLDEEITSRRVPPSLAVLPTTYVGRASECVDAVHGERDETYLTHDVLADLAHAFSIAPGRSAATLGYSEGGFCAVNLALHDPGAYVGAASLSGYFTAGVDTGTGPGSAYDGSRHAVDLNSPLWWAAHHRGLRGPALFLASGSADRQSETGDLQLQRVLAAASPALPVVVPLLPGGGHNFGTWSAALAPALDFLATRLPRPLAPPQVLPTDPAARRL